MKYFSASIVVACLIGGVVSANEGGSGVLSHNCPPSCPSQGPQGPGAEKGDRDIVLPARESSSSESHENDTSTEKPWPPVAY